MSTAVAVTTEPAGPRVVADVRVIKADDTGSSGAAVRARGWEYEDEFKGLYGPLPGGTQQLSDVQIIEPPYLPRTLEALCQQNNTLNVCVAAIVTNVHGTGFDIKAKDEKDAKDPRIAEIAAFFEETYPGESFRDLRRQLGKDLERIGHCYIEVIRALTGEIMFLRRLDPKMMRLVKKGEERRSKVKVVRNGKTVEVPMMVRWRRFVQTLNGTQLLYFKDYGCSDPMSSKTGQWGAATIGEAASEVIYMTRDDDALTPYGVPAWLAQIPSVLGSRKAEELNLTFFDHGGVPPMMVFVNGGSLTPRAADALRQHLSGGNKHTIPVIETVSTGGTIDSPSAVKVTIERFGSERQDDSMFENYDERCEKRVRRAWRLPPLFIGATDDYNFASAYASYLVAEAQVFAPERQEFDDMINRKIMRELDPEGKFLFVSRPINIKDVDKQINALKMAVDAQAIGQDQLIDVLNSMTALGLRVDTDNIVMPVQLAGQMMSGFGGIEGEPGAAPQDPGTQAGRTAMGDPVSQKIDVSALALKAYGMLTGDVPKDRFVSLITELRTLPKSEVGTFKKALTNMALDNAQTSEHGASLLTNAVLTMLGQDANPAA